jgi:hypothetical protein
MTESLKSPRCWLLFAALLAATFTIRSGSSTAALQNNPEAADLILHHGFVWTVDEAKPTAEAIAVRGDKIIRVGSNPEVMRLRSDNTRVIDLKGAFVVPGFNDNHVHFASAASFFWNIQLMDVHTDEAFVARVKEYVAAHPGEAIRGGGWGAYEQWEMGARQDISDHEQLQLYHEFLDAGRLTARVNFRYGIEHWQHLKALGIRRGSGNAMIRLGAVKGHIDGIMGTSGARFYEPYSNDPEKKNRGHWRPLTWVSPERRTELNRGPFTQMMIDADAADIQVTVHAIGDEALGVMLDMIEAMTKANGPRDRRMRLVHAQVFAPRDFDRLKGLGVVAEVQPFHLSDDMRWMEERIGYERCKGAYAFKTIQAKGAVLSFGSDWPGTSASIYPISPIYALYAAVTRQTVQRTPAEGWFPGERLTIEEALRAYTWGSAYASLEEQIKGTLSEGRLADLTVLDTNLLRTRPTDWIDERGTVKVRTLYTLVGGRIVHQRAG